MSAPRTLEPGPAEAPWPAIERRLLHGSRPAPMPFPLALLPPAWAGWIEGAAPSFTSVDYVAQALLGAVSALCGGRWLVEVAPPWREPLVLWQALVGGPSTGKTPALALGRDLVERVLARGGARTTHASELRVDARADMLARTASHTPSSIALWCDDLAGWLAGMSNQERGLALAGWSGGRAHVPERPRFLAIEVDRFPLSVVGTLQADRLTSALGGPDDGPAARFLYAWPVPRLEVVLGRQATDRPDVSAMLARLAALPATLKTPMVLPLEAGAVEALQPILTALRGFMLETDGIEAAWIGKGAGNIVRLAGLLGLMDWAAEPQASAPAGVAAAHVERAHSLWTDYFWPHAQAVFGQGGTTLADRQTRRIARWLRRVRPDAVSREEIRREALCQTVDAQTAEELIERLERHGALRPLAPQGAALGGPRKRRWEINPELWAS